MADYIYDSFGIKRKISHINAVARLEKLKETSGTNPWPVIEECLKVWESKAPKTYESYLIHLDNVKKTRKDSKFASTYDKQTGGYLRYTLDIPQDVMYMIRCLYTADELPMNKRFFESWAKKFPKMMIAEKL